jgi:metal-sulfur cluster biosynthetic enzyme
MSTVELVRSALAQVNDPELHRPITELGMVRPKPDVMREPLADIDLLLMVQIIAMHEI